MKKLKLICLDCGKKFKENKLSIYKSNYGLGNIYVSPCCSSVWDYDKTEIK